MKYRGKQAIDDHRWYYGDALRGIHADCYIIGQSVNEGEYFFVKVVPETLTQCIDHVDINGVDIYEGDIIKIQKYDTYASEQDEKYEAFYVLTTKRGFLGKLTQEGRFSRVEVVGNRWDNPYLLERCKSFI